MKASVLAELLQQYPNATVLHHMPYKIDEEIVDSVNEYRVFLKGDYVDMNVFFSDYDVEYLDKDTGLANMDMIVLISYLA